MITREKFYKENGLKLETLAERLNNNRHFVSQGIRQIYKTIFIDEITSKRKQFKLFGATKFLVQSFLFSGNLREIKKGTSCPICRKSPAMTAAGFSSFRSNILTKLRFENRSNKKTLKQAWRFFLLNYLFVTAAEG
ncbi:MAG: hypothetical protein R2819_03075 [Allomuricauda sp.]